MKILSIDTSAKIAYVSLCEEKNGIVTPVAQYSFVADSHTVALTRMIDSVLNLTNNTLDDVDMFAVSAGPGSFTGIRIGVSAVKGMSFAKNQPCVGVSSVMSLAVGQAMVKGIVTPLIDARRGTYYTAAFESDGRGNITRLTPDAQLETAEYVEMLRKYIKNGKKLILTGDGAAKMAEYLDSLDEKIADTTVMSAFAAYGVAICAAELYHSAEDKSAFTGEKIQPVYLKKSQAERERDERLSVSEKTPSTKN